jgi:Fe-S-cluster-containing dehydrogenase component/DMSO reductase anchor subunit
MIALPIVSEHEVGSRVADSPPARTGNPAALHGPDLVAQLLADQQQLTAVEQFSRTYDSQSPKARGELYRALLPAELKAGQQYAFEVDLDRCSGCKACVTACHTLNGLDENESFRSVGLLVGGSSALPVLQHVTAACHHCLEPACMIACPVNAYEKSPVTGIVKHLDDQCFGCQYCTLACPYDVPKYHAGKGIVRKCDMCSSRLEVGEPPACVQACPHQAITITVTDVERIVADAETSHFLPGAPDPQITLPSTTYKSRRALPRNLLPADYFQTSAQHAHLPLVIMLVLTQLSVGAFTGGLLLKGLVDRRLVEALEPLLLVNALVFGLLALAASTMHLGRPQFAFRAVLGLRHSWLSREILAFGLFAKLAIVYAAAVWFQLGGLIDNGQALIDALGWAVAGSGFLGVFCSAMIYVFTQRECWSFTRVMVRFLLTGMLLGVGMIWFSILALELFAPSPQLAELVRRHGTVLCRAVMLSAALKLAWDAAIFRHLLVRRTTSLKRSAQLAVRQLSRVTLARYAAGFMGGLLMPALLLSHVSSVTDQSRPEFVVATAMLFLACLAGELLERYLFFAACASPRMPGTI